LVNISLTLDTKSSKYSITQLRVYSIPVDFIGIDSIILNGTLYVKVSQLPDIRYSSSFTPKGFYLLYNPKSDKTTNFGNIPLTVDSTKTDILFSNSALTMPTQTPQPTPRSSHLSLVSDSLELAQTASLPTITLATLDTSNITSSTLQRQDMQILPEPIINIIGPVGITSANLQGVNLLFSGANGQTVKAIPLASLFAGQNGGGEDGKKESWTHKHGVLLFFIILGFIVLASFLAYRYYSSLQAKEFEEYGIDDYDTSVSGVEKKKLRQSVHENVDADLEKIKI